MFPRLQIVTNPRLGQKLERAELEGPLLVWSFKVKDLAGFFARSLRNKDLTVKYLRISELADFCPLTASALVLNLSDEKSDAGHFAEYPCPWTTQSASVLLDVDTGAQVVVGYM